MTRSESNNQAASPRDLPTRRGVGPQPRHWGSGKRGKKHQNGPGGAISFLSSVKEAERWIPRPSCKPGGGLATKGRSSETTAILAAIRAIRRLRIRNSFADLHEIDSLPRRAGATGRSGIRSFWGCVPLANPRLQCASAVWLHLLSRATKTVVKELSEHCISLHQPATPRGVGMCCRPEPTLWKFRAAMAWRLGAVFHD